MQLTFSYLAALVSTSVALFLPAGLFLLITPPVLDDSSAASSLEPPQSSEGMGGVEVLTLRTVTARGIWS
jgi:hypothetical protein